MGRIKEHYHDEICRGIDDSDWDYQQEQAQIRAQKDAEDQQWEELREEGDVEVE